MNGSEKIVEALIQLMEGYHELRESVEEEVSGNDIADEDEEQAEIERSLSSEVKAALDSAIDAEGFAPDELAPLVMQLKEAIEELDPAAFSALTKTDDSEAEDEDDEDYDEDEDEDDEDLDDDEDEDDED